MIDILLSDPFMSGAIGMVLFLLALVIVVPMFTRRHQYDSRQWRVIEPPELLTEVKRIAAKEVEAEQVYIDSNHRPARLRYR